MNKLVDGLRKELNRTLTDNGAVSNESSLNSLLDFFAAGAALRNAEDSRGISMFSDAFAEDRLLALRTLFYFRDVRGGQGERKVFRNAFAWLARNYPDIARKNLVNVVEFGRWDDLLVLENTKLWDDVIEMIDTQLISDLVNFNKDTGISLLAKWLPSVNTSSKESVRLGKKIARALGMSDKKYRKILSKLRKHLDVVERKLCNKDYTNIDYEKVPSRAAMIYRNTFRKKDESRYQAYLNAVKNGEKHINSSVLYPYDIVRPMFNSYNSSGIIEDDTLDAQWNALPNYLKNNIHNGLVVCDVSGSMYESYSKNVMPICVSVSLAIYFAERNVGPFQNYFMTFSERPKLQKINGKTIFEKVRSLTRSNWGYNTDLQSVFDEILLTAKKNSLVQADLPDVVYIISDMQFDHACPENDVVNFVSIDNKFNEAGYTRPRLVFWNVNASGNKQFTVTVDDHGTCMVSGCSPVILQSVLDGEIVTPFDVLLKTVNAERYECIKV